jgi:Flp pilus assembly protein TadG
MTDFADASGSSAPAASVRQGNARALRQRPIVRERRGAILVWAGVLVLALVGFGAFAVDFGSFYVTAAELQTAADAAALAGARTLQTSANTGATRAGEVDTRAVAVANANQAWGSALAITADSVDLRFWDPVTRTVSATAPAGFDFNAVEVRTGRSASFLFGHVLKNTFGVGDAPKVNRSAVAWIANFQNGKCILPMALPYRSLYDRVAAITGLSNPAGVQAPVYPGKRPDLTQAQLAALDDLPNDAQRLIIFRPTNYNGAGANPDSSQALGSMGVNHGRYVAYNISGSAGGTEFQSGVITCSTQYFNVGMAVDAHTLPGNNDIECLTVNALMGSVENTCKFDATKSSWPLKANEPKVTQPVTCHFRPVSAPYDAGCYTSTAYTTQGILKQVSWGDSVTTGSQETKFRMIGKLKIYCVFRLPAGSGVNEVCNTDMGTVTPSNYPRGTVVGVIQGLGRPPLEGASELGNIPSDQQKLILVR